MSVFANPAIVKTGLVLAFDAANGACYRGEATTNLIPSPTANAYPTTGNSWGTYNTNQYGSGTYFSIGTISSVSGNVVTTSGNHGLRTYDVMQPQTTGGGVTAAVNYFIKRISDTQFTLHEYNSSQDGSQGYINPSTGYHKVHDSIANDTRISVNSTNFPTMWWGYPHLPNAGLVKELITKGFTGMPGSDPTDCMRQHITRPVGADHMAYNVDASVTIGQPVVSSFWARAVTQSAVGKSGTFYHYNYGGVSGADAFATGFTLGEVGVWQRYLLGFTPTRNTLISYWFNADGGPYSYDIANIQIEQRSSATPFVAGTRGTTVATNGGLRDMSGNAYHGETVNGPTFNTSNGGCIQFDGSNDYIDVASSLGTMSNYTIMFWAYRSAENRMPIAGRTSTAFYWYGDNSWAYTHGGTWGEYYYSKPTSIPLNTWGHYCVVYNGSNVSIYRQGVYQGQQSTTGTADWSQGLRIGYWSAGGSYAWNGLISSVLMYNTALSASEVLQNFNAQRKRFGV